MKKLLLFGLMLCFTGVFAQQAIKATATHNINSPMANQTMRLVPHNGEGGGCVPINNNPSLRYVTSGGPSVQFSSISESIIGNTQYDLQTNGSIANRFVYNADGTMSAVWTFSPDYTSGYPNRGTGYSYFNGSSWSPTNTTTRLEGSSRAGFTNIGVTASGKELVIAHGIQTNGSSLGMLLTTRSPKGTGTWSTDPSILGEEPADTLDLFPRMVVGGADGKSIHAIWRGGSTTNIVSGQGGPIFYSRSTTDGATWDKVETILTPIDSDFYFGFSGDQYSMDARGDTIAIVVGSWTSDLVLLKSTDNGNNWDKTVIVSFPIPFYDPTSMVTDIDNDGTPDTLYTNNGDATVVLDNSGMAHVFFSVNRIIQSTAGGGLFYFPYTNGLDYWNENMVGQAPALIAFAPDLDADGFISIPIPTNQGFCSTSDNWGFGIYDGGITERPSAGVDENNNIYLCYQTVDELSDTTYFGKDFKHVYVIKSTDGGNNWTDANLALDIVAATQPVNNTTMEGVYACMAKRVDNKVRIIYQRDAAPGLLLNFDACDSPNNMIAPTNNVVYVEVDTSLAVGINEIAEKQQGLLLSPNYPNPAKTSTQFNVTLNSPANVKIDVTDLLGQNLYSENRGKLSAGVHTVTLNTSYLSSGVYFYSVTAGTEKVTGKMIVE